MNKDRLYLQHIQRNIASIQRLATAGRETFFADEDQQAAVLYYLQTLSESTTRLSSELRETHPEIAWQQIRGFRNRIAHDYLSIDLELVWLIITSELTPLRTAVEALLAGLPPEDEE